MKCSFALVALFAGHVVAVNLPLCDYVCAVAAAKRIGCGPALSKALTNKLLSNTRTSCAVLSNLSPAPRCAKVWRWGSVSAIVHSFMLSLPPLYKPFPE
ncbi:hypothetical protein FS749_000257 [Ceratobasidium sp. UAMH 11750]|nr:hypothetical protein FS749_000257 [Ceratobasidium sp. UAMH 11750]